MIALYIDNHADLLIRDRDSGVERYLRADSYGSIEARLTSAEGRNLQCGRTVLIRPGDDRHQHILRYLENDY